MPFIGHSVGSRWSSRSAKACADQSLPGHERRRRPSGQPSRAYADGENRTEPQSHRGHRERTEDKCFSPSVPSVLSVLPLCRCGFGAATGNASNQCCSNSRGLLPRHRRCCSRNIESNISCTPANLELCCSEVLISATGDPMSRFGD